MSVIFGLDPNESQALHYPEAHDETYEIRPLTDDLQSAWRKKTTKHRWKGGQRIEDRDEEAYHKLFWDHIIASWEGAIYLSRDDARANRTSPCDLEHKLKFIATQPDRALWMVQKAQTMGEDFARQVELERDTFRKPLPGATGPSAEGSEL